MNANGVVACWNEVFPNSYCSHNVILGSSSFVFYLAKDKTETPNQIMNNDPLHYVAFLREDSFEESDSPYMYVKPTIPNRVYGSVKMRKKTIKNVDRTKLIARFNQVREFVMSNKDNMKNICFDINTK